MKKVLLCAALGTAALLSSSGAFAQSRSNWCATEEHNAELARTFHDPQLAAQRKAADDLAERLQLDDTFARQFRAQHRTAVASRVVPVVVHVVTKCGTEALTEARVQAGLAQLNADWSRTNADANQTRPQFLPYAANLDVEFRLAKLDPQGNPTTGIHRITDLATLSVVPRDQIKQQVPYWDGYFNVWIVDGIDAGQTAGIILGYAQFPGTGPWSTWGLVMRFDDWTANPISNGRTASHEMGHCFNLYHSFTDGGGCGGSCTSTADRVCDTPASASSYEPCYLTSPRNTCSNETTTGTVYTTNVPDQDENFMSYNNCQNMFTQGQKARVDAAFVNFPYLANLISPANLLRTGVADGQTVPSPVPVGYINTCQLSVQGDETIACVGKPITFNSSSYGAALTGLSWSFPNATPATSTDANPTVVFNTPGVQTITLTPMGASGPGTPQSLTVRVLAAPQAVPVVEGFEGGQQLTSSLWRVASSSYTSSNRWRLIGLTAPNVTTEGDTAIRMQNGSVPAGTTNTLYSPAYDTRNIVNNPIPTLKFDVAYAQRSSSSTDELKVSLSADCGRTWQVKRTLAGAALSTTGGALIANFTPTALSQWRTESINITGQFLNQPSVLVKFESTSGQTNSNNVYIDNVRLDGQLMGVAETLAAAGVALAPNPLTAETALTFSLARATRVGVRVTDILGRPVLTEAPRTMAPGEHLLLLGTRLQHAAAGVYVVTVELDGSAYSQKLLLQ